MSRRASASFLAGAGAVAAISLVGAATVRKNVHLWIGAYLRQALARRWRPPAAADTVDVLFCLVDHFEPVRQEQMDDWSTRYPTLAAAHRDSSGCRPRHTWFYPGEQYRADFLEAVVALARQGLGEVELHLHHGHDTSASLRQRIEQALADFRSHGALLSEGEPPVETYGFIHGNMALDNSRGDPRWCGVNDELEILEATGCYADFSAPTAPANSQTRTINRVYYAIDDPTAPKSHDTGVDVAVGAKDRRGLMIVQGPLCLDWANRKHGVLPRIDNAEITGANPGRPDRVERWLRQHVHVLGRPEWVIVKASCHGADDRHREALLGAEADAMYAHLEARFRDRPGYRLHYVTARELYNIIKAAEAGHDGDPAAFRNFVIPPYRNRAAGASRPGASRG